MLKYFLAQDYRFANILVYIHHQLIIKIVNNFFAKNKKCWNTLHQMNAK